jgi:heptosyltransferase-2
MIRRSTSVSRVLVVLPNWLGDVVMAMPLLALLDGARSPAGESLEIVACVRRRWAPLLARDPRLTRVITYHRGGRHSGLRGLVRLAARWRATRSDAVLLCPPSLRVAATAVVAGIGRRVGYAVGGRRPLLSLALPGVRPRGRVHHADELRRLGLAFLETLGWPAPEHANGVPSLPGLDPIAPTVLGAGPPVWVLAPGATYGPAKTWPVARAAEFVAEAIHARSVRVAIVGDTTTAEFTAALRRQLADVPWRRELPGPAGVVDLVGGTTLVDLAALLKSSEAFLGNDSGVMHLSAALGVPTLGLFGSSSVEWTGPRGPRARALTAKGFACQPCFRRTCNQKVFCLDTLAAPRVLEVLDTLRDGAPAPGER